jgi:hypothetical protein
MARLTDFHRQQPPAPSRGRLFPRPRALRGASKSSRSTCRIFPRWSATLPRTAGPLSVALSELRTTCCPRSGPCPSPSLFPASQAGRTAAIREALQGVPARPLFRGRGAPSAPLKAAAASPGFWPAAHPTVTPLHVPYTYYSSPTVPSHLL